MELKMCIPFKRRRISTCEPHEIVEEPKWLSRLRDNLENNETTQKSVLGTDIRRRLKNGESPTKILKKLRELL